MSYYTKQEINGRMSLRHADYLCDSCHRAMYARLCNLQSVNYGSIAEDAHNKFNTLMCEVYGWPEDALTDGFYDTVTFLMTAGSKNGIRIKPRHMLPKMIKLAISGEYEILGKLSAEIRDVERKVAKKATREKKDKALEAFFEVRRKIDVLKEKCDKGDLDIDSYVKMSRELLASVEI